jgi:hypothetical protein
MPEVPAVRPFRLAVVLSLLAAFAGSAAQAQTLSGRPFRTEAASTLDWGEHALELGGEYRSEMTPLPILGAGVQGDYWRVPVLRYRAGLGRAEVQVAGALMTGFSPDPAGLDSEDEVGDFAIWLKIEALREAPGRPGLGVLVGTKLPNASDETGLGTDETDVFLALALSKTTGVHELRLNLGLAILGDPATDSSQEDLLTYGLAGRHGDRHAFLWEVWGRALGDEDRDLEESTARLGYGWFGERVSFDASLLVGLEDVSGDLGASLGVTWLLGAARAQ